MTRKSAGLAYALVAVLAGSPVAAAAPATAVRPGGPSVLEDQASRSLEQLRLELRSAQERVRALNGEIKAELAREAEQGTDIVDLEREFAAAYARASSAHADLAAGNWDEALAEVRDLRSRLDSLAVRFARLAKAHPLPEVTRQRLAAMRPLVISLEDLVVSRSAVAVPAAAAVVRGFEATTTELAVARYWPQGGAPAWAIRRAERQVPANGRCAEKSAGQLRVIDPPQASCDLWWVKTSSPPGIAGGELPRAIDGN